MNELAKITASECVLCLEAVDRRKSDDGLFEGEVEVDGGEGFVGSCSFVSLWREEGEREGEGEGRQGSWAAHSEWIRADAG